MIKEVDENKTYQRYNGALAGNEISFRRAGRQDIDPLVTIRALILNQFPNFTGEFLRALPVYTQPGRVA